MNDDNPQRSASAATAHQRIGAIAQAVLPDTQQTHETIIAFVCGFDTAIQAVLRRPELAVRIGGALHEDSDALAAFWRDYLAETVNGAFGDAHIFDALIARERERTDHAGSV